MKTIIFFLAICLNASDAMANGMIWNCEGAISKVYGESAFMSVQLHSATLSIEQADINFDLNQKNPNTDLQIFDLERYTLLFMPQTTFVNSANHTAKALAFVVRKDHSQDVTRAIALDTLLCKGQ